jgi:hypothetical protein
MVALVGKALPPDANPWVQAGALLGCNVLLSLAVLVAMTVSGRRVREQQTAVSGEPFAVTWLSLAAWR